MKILTDYIYFGENVFDNFKMPVKQKKMNMRFQNANEADSGD